MDKFRSTMKLGNFGEEEIDKAAKAVKNMLMIQFMIYQMYRIQQHS